MTNLPTWVQWTQALTVPTIAAVGAGIAFLNWKLAVRRRGDELFDRRYAYFQKVVAIWSEYSSDNNLFGDFPGMNLPPLDARLVLAVEAKFLFGDDIAEHVQSYGRPFGPLTNELPNEDFVEPFEKYLRLSAGKRSALQL